MRAILLCGYRAPTPDQSIPGGDVIDTQIECLKSLGLETICVLAGHAAEAQLRVCRKIADADLVFDTNEPATLMSNLRAGLHALENEPCLVLPMDVACPDPGAWRALLNETLRIGAGKTMGLHFMTLRHFPLMLTREGCEFLRQNRDVADLSDTRLNYLQVDAQFDPILAPSAKPL